MDTKQASKILVRMMLVMLGLISLAGVGMIFTGTDEALWRMVITAISTLVACGMVYRALRQINRPALRPSAIGTIIFCGVELLLVNAALYADLFNRSLEKPAITAFVTFAVIFPSLLFLRILTLPGGRGSAYSGMALALLAWSIFVFQAWSQQIFDSEKWLGVGLTICLAAVLVPANLFDPGKGLGWVLRLGGAAMALLGTAGASGAIVMKSSHSFVEFVLAHTGIPLLAVAFWLGFANLINRVRTTGPMRWVRYATLLAAGAMALLISAAILSDYYGAHYTFSEALARAAAAAGVVWVCASAGLLLAMRFSRGVEIVRSASVDKVEMTCPICRAAMTVPVTAWDPQATGPAEEGAPASVATDARCASCNLIVRVQLRAPTCDVCGYLLYHIKGDSCPECGAKTRLPAAAGGSGNSGIAQISPPDSAAGLSPAGS